MFKAWFAFVGLFPAADDFESIKDYLQQHFPRFAEPTRADVVKF